MHLRPVTSAHWLVNLSQLPDSPHDEHAYHSVSWWKGRLSCVKLKSRNSRGILNQAAIVSVCRPSAFSPGISVDFWHMLCNSSAKTFVVPWWFLKISGSFLLCMEPAYMPSNACIIHVTLHRYNEEKASSEHSTADSAANASPCYTMNTCPAPWKGKYH